MRSNPSPRLLILPGLQGSGPDHWQTWLEREAPDAYRVHIADWSDDRIDQWVNQINRTLDATPDVPWLVVAHSFGCLALARWAAVSNPQRVTQRVQGAILVAPANPERFDLPAAGLDRPLPFRSTVVTSRNDPWFDELGACRLGQRWGARRVDAGAAGHINPASGHGPWPLGAQLVADELARLNALAATTVTEAKATIPRLQFAV